MKDKDVLASISPEQALRVLRKLWEKGGDIRKAVALELESILVEVDVDELGEEVMAALDSIDVHELWDRSGAHSGGYSPPDEVAMEMVEEELAPFIEQMDNYHALGMSEEEKLYCIGILKGLYAWEKGAESEFADWAVDMPVENFRLVLSTWKERSRNQEHITEMDEFIRVNCPDWAR